jgi:hypothetical protein
MKDTNGHKYSDETTYKQNMFEKIIDCHIKLSMRIIKKRKITFPYRYFDLNGGTGYIEEINCYGGAYRFGKVAKENGLYYKGEVFETQESYIDTLRNVLKPYEPHMTVHHRNHNDLIHILDHVQFEWGMGLSYSDPYGTDISIEVINKIAKKYPAADALIYISSTTFKRVDAVWNFGAVETMINKIDKKYWHFTFPHSKGQWCFILGTAWDNFPEYEKIGFHRFDNPKFIHEWQKILYTKKEIAEQRGGKQLDFFEIIDHPKKGWATYQNYLASPKFKVIRKKVMLRANNICEQCGNCRASEVHHIKYSEWYNGEVDIPENIIAICHPCHCIIHDKEN